MRFLTCSFSAVVVWTFTSSLVGADTTVFFEPCQVAAPVGSGDTWDTIEAGGYLFTYTRDKLFTGGGGQPIGRPVRVPWPQGVEAQAVTAPPPGMPTDKARITLQRVDGQGFDLTAFTAKLLANTFGAGGRIEIMPLVQGEDAFPDPLYFDASGFYGQTFSYDASPSPWGSTALLVGFDTYKISLYVDFALVALALNGPAGPESCCLPGPSCVDLTAAACAAHGGSAQGGGTSCACDPCATAAGAPPVPDGQSGTAPLRASRASTDTIELSWDSASCPAPGYNVIFGSLSGVESYSVSGAICAVGTSGSHTWTGVPAADLYFLMVGTDGAGAESSWGRDGAGNERNGSGASNRCGATWKDLSAGCP